MRLRPKAQVGLALAAMMIAGGLAACTLLTDFGDVDPDGPAGDFMVVWSQAPTGTTSYSVQAQRYASFGEQGQTVPLDAQPTGAGLYPSVDMEPQGRAVVTWASIVDLTSGEYRAQLIDATGAVEGSSVVLQADAVNIPGKIKPLLDTSGFWAAFQCDDDSYHGVCGGRFDAAGSALVGTVLMNSNTTGVQYFGGLAPLPNGGAVVVWSVRDELDAQNPGIHGGRFNASGHPISTPD